MVSGCVGSVRHVVCLHAREISEFIKQHVVVGAEQCQAVESTDEVLHHGVGDGIAIESRGASAKLVEDGKGAAGCELQNVPRLFHFNVESTFAFQNPVTRSDSREDAIDWCEFTALCRHVAPHLS